MRATEVTGSEDRWGGSADAKEGGSSQPRCQMVTEGKEREWGNELPRALAGSEHRLVPTHGDGEHWVGTSLIAEVRPNRLGFECLWLEILLCLL